MVPAVPGSPQTGSPFCGVASGSQGNRQGWGLERTVLWGDGTVLPNPRPFLIPPGLQNKLLELNSERCR